MIDLFSYKLGMKAAGDNSGGTVEFGGTYTFKKTIPDTDWSKLLETALFDAVEGYTFANCQFNGKSGWIMFAPNSMTGYGSDIFSASNGMDIYGYFTSAAPAVGITEAGWYLLNTGKPVEPPTITLTSNKSEIYIPLEILSTFFDGVGNHGGDNTDTLKLALSLYKTGVIGLLSYKLGIKAAKGNTDVPKLAPGLYEAGGYLFV